MMATILHNVTLPGPRPPLVCALPLLKVDGAFGFKVLWLKNAFRFSLVRSSFLGADTGDSNPVAEETKGKPKINTFQDINAEFSFSPPTTHWMIMLQHKTKIKSTNFKFK